MNHKSFILFALLLLSTVLPVFCHDKAVANAFAQAENFAKQQKTFASSKDEGAKQQSHQNVQQIKSITSALKPAQLVELVKMCKTKVHETPSDSKHQSYSAYLESLMHISILRLGELRTADSAKALEELKPVLAGASSLTETLAEAESKLKGTNKP